MTDKNLQKGAMQYSEPPVDLDTVRRYRLARIHEQLRQRDYAGILLFDPCNTRYATDTTNMQLWSMHNEQRYVLVLTDGPVILFEGESATHLADGFCTVDEIRYGTGWYYFAAGSRYQELAGQWANELAELVKGHGGDNLRLAVDRAGSVGLDHLRGHGIEIFDGFEVMELAREIKSDGEIALMKAAIATCEAGMWAMWEALEPGITENRLWSLLHQVNIEQGGEWIETRLLSSGPRTNPWYQECSHRVIEAGDLVAFDTDLIGPYGYCADISRTWVCGAEPSPQQQRLHELACAELEHNINLLGPGVGFRELAQKAWPLPESFRPQRYSCLGHGVGLADEYPNLPHLEDFAATGYDGELQAGSVVCMESYMGEPGGREGVKLEQQVLITEKGYELLSAFPIGLRPT